MEMGKPAVGAASHDHSEMPADMAHDMGHSGTDMSAMVRDMRNRFWICLIFTIPIFVYAPMGRFFTPPAPPFGLPLNLGCSSWRAPQSFIRAGRSLSPLGAQLSMAC